MREIKFRIFDKNIPANGTDKELNNPSGAMVTKWDYIINSAYLVDGLTGKYPIMQFTGMKDKKGNDIYEKDIIKVEDAIGIIEYYAPHFYIGQTSGKTVLYNHGMNFLWDEVEVIGNIYENIRLLD